MIELNNKTQHDFLNREWVQKLLDAGVDMSDAKYAIQVLNKKDHIIYVDNWKEDYSNTNMLPTYTVSELLYKLHEWIYPMIDDKEYSGGLRFFKDAPFYIFYYDLKTNGYNRCVPPEKQTDKWNDQYIFAEFDNPIESLAFLLIQCHSVDIGLKTKDTGNIQEKYKN